MKGRTRLDARMEKHAALKLAEESGEVADSMDVRTALVNRMNAGELTLEQVQTELRRIKRNAKKNGKLTRTQVWNRS